jgi:hypothetical protein
MTEDEAKKKWCPCARTVEKWNDGTSSPRNRVAIGESTTEVHNLVGTKCIASACMAWRWSMSANSPELGGGCGLAGAPQ